MEERKKKIVEPCYLGNNNNPIGFIALWLETIQVSSTLISCQQFIAKNAYLFRTPEVII